MINKQNGKITLEFGHGTIRHTGGLIENSGVLSLNSCKQREVGISEDTVETTSSMLNSDIVLRFSSVKSIEVLILKLQEIRGLMLGKDITEVEKYKRYLHDITLAYQPNSLIDNMDSMDGCGYILGIDIAKKL